MSLCSAATEYRHNQISTIYEFLIPTGLNEHCGWWQEKECEAFEVHENVKILL